MARRFCLARKRAKEVKQGRSNARANARASERLTADSSFNALRALPIGDGNQRVITAAEQITLRHAGLTDGKQLRAMSKGDIEAAEKQLEDTFRNDYSGDAAKFYAAWVDAGDENKITAKGPIKLQSIRKKLEKFQNALDKDQAERAADEADDNAPERSFTARQLAQQLAQQRARGGHGGSINT